MKRFIVVVSFVVGLAAANTIVTNAAAAGVNCSMDACLKQCTKNGATEGGCNNFCTKAIRDRKFAGQCK
jgi:hypothetical protein